MENEMIFIGFGILICIFIIYQYFCKNNNTNRVHVLRRPIGIRVDIMRNNLNRVEENRIRENRNIEENYNNDENEILESVLSISVESYKKEYEKKLKKLKVIKLKNHPNYSDENLECPISFDSLNFEEEIYLIPCKHIFKKKNLEEMLRLKNECPICREEIF